MAYWIWIVAGLALLGAEMFIPSGFVLMFFGGAAVIVGFLVAGGMATAPWLQWLLFSAISIGAVVFLRSRIVGAPVLGRMDTDELVGKVGTCLKTFDSNGEGRVDLRGSSWEASSLDGEAINAGDRCTVVRTEGVRLFVRKGL